MLRKIGENCWTYLLPNCYGSNSNSHLSRHFRRGAKLPESGSQTLVLDPVVDGVTLPTHPFDPAAPAISANKPLMVGWNEDEYTFFAWERKDTSAFGLDFAGLEAKLEAQYGSDTKRIIETYRSAMPNASRTDIFVAIASITMMGLGSVEIAEKKAAAKWRAGISVSLWL